MHIDYMQCNENNTIYNEFQGGKVIGSGGYGCVFSPPLHCKTNSKDTHNNKKYVTKLLTKKDALIEYNDVLSIKQKLQVIPNYYKYFLIDDFSLCHNIAPLTHSDLSNFHDKCTTFSDDKITKENINENLDKLIALNMPYGGIQLDTLIYNKVRNNLLDVFVSQINSELMKLLYKGIVPMNKLHIYHSDIKDANILVNESSNATYSPKLIDWGVTTNYVPFIEQLFPFKWKNKPLQFNVPFSIILFTDAFIQKYTEFIQSNNNTFNFSQLEDFVIKYIYYWVEARGIGHLDYLNKMMIQALSKSRTNEINSDSLHTITIPYISNYLTKIIQKSIKTKTYNNNINVLIREYLDNVFIHNIDLWGFCTIYYPIFEIYYENYINLTLDEKKTLNSIKTLFVYLFTTPGKLSINKIIKILSTLNKHNKSINKRKIINKSVKNTISQTKLNNKTTKFNNKTLKIK
jgi:hypothetical protein